MYEQLKSQEELWLIRLRSELSNLPDNHNLNGFPLGEARARTADSG